MGVAFNGLFLIKTTEKSKNRFLKQVGNYVKVVEVTPEQDLDKYFEWEIVHPLRTPEELINRPTITRKVSMNMAESMGQQWSHHDVQMNEPVPVIVPHKEPQYWKMVTRLDGVRSTVTFTKIEKVASKPLLVGWESEQVLLVEDSNPDNPKSFSAKFKSNGFILERIEACNGNQYIGVSGAESSILAFHEFPRSAKVWFPEPSPDENFVYLATIGPSKKGTKMTK